jgi:hypothetical protein
MAKGRFDDVYVSWASYAAKRDLNEDINPRDLRSTFSCPIKVIFRHGDLTVIVYNNETRFVDLNSDRTVSEGFRSDCFDEFERGFFGRKGEKTDCYKAGVELREKYFP